MTVVKIKRSKTDDFSEESSQAKKKIKIKTKLNEDNAKVIPKIKINLKKDDHSDSANVVKRANSIKVKLNLKKNDENANGIKVKRHEPRVRVKAIRIPGEGYDSEDSDVESDPLIESGIILRVVPDTQVDFVKNSIEAGDYSGIGIKWITERHAVVLINGYMYGAILVDLPTIIEVNKSVDRKNLLKTFDVSQMLLCIKTIDKEEEVYDLQVPDSEDMVSNHYEDIIQEIHREKIKLLRQHLSHGNHDITPQQIDKIAIKSYDYKHGLTAPLYNVRNRRFRRKMNPTEFEYVENVVETLLNEDDKAEEATFELITEEEINTKPLPMTSQSHLNLSSQQQQQVNSVTIKTNPPITSTVTDNSAIKLENNGTQQKGRDMEEEEDDDDDDELDLEAAFESDEEDDNDEEVKDLQQEIKYQNEITSKTETKVNGEEEDLFDGSGAEEGAVEEDESEEDEDEEEDEEEDDDDDNNESRGGRDEKRQHIELLEDELKELESTLTQTIRKVEKATNPLLKSRFVESIKKLEKEVELKKKQLKANEESVQHNSKTDEDTSSNNDKYQKHIDSKQQEQPNNDGDEDEDEDVDDDDDVDVDDEEDEDEDEEESVEDTNRDGRQGQVNSTENNENNENEDESLDQNDLDMMMLFGAEAEEDE